MFWFNFPYPISPFIFSQPKVTQVSQTYIDLDNISENERVNIYEDDESQIAEVQKFNPLGNKWDTEYKKVFDKFSATYAVSHFWKELSKNILLISNTMGSGNYLTYVILERKNAQLQVFFEKSGVFQGQIWFEGNDLIEGEGNRFKKLEIKDGKIVLEHYSLPIVQGAKLIHYSISPNGTVNVVNDISDMNVGDTVQLLRTDDNNIDDRVLFMEGSQAISYIPQRSAFRINEKVNIEIDIIPFGYNWDKAKKIVIQVK